MNHRNWGDFITVEGIDGCGKTSCIPVIAGFFTALGREVVQTREPGGSDLAEALRALILGKPMDSTTELLLMNAARRDHAQTKIWPAIQRGAVVVSDRFADSTVAYQSFGRGYPLHKINQMVSLATESAENERDHLTPDTTYWFDLPPSVAASRMAGSRDKLDRFELEAEAFFARVRMGYAHIHSQDPARVVRVDATMSQEDVKAFLLESLQKRYGQ
jgi:dTMP kinase